MKQRQQQSETNGYKQRLKSRVSAKLWAHSENEMIPDPAFYRHPYRSVFPKGTLQNPQAEGGVWCVPPESSLYKEGKREWIKSIFHLFWLVIPLTSAAT